MLLDGAVSWRILGKLFGEPENEFYVKELARELKISPGSASTVCRELKKEGVLKSSEKGNALFYSLENEDPFVKRLKSAWILDKLLRFRSCWERDEIHSVVLYGSRASGDFISKSDIDILVITNIPEKELGKALEPMKKKFGRQLAFQVFSVAQWAKLAKEKDRFYIEVIANHVTLFGSSPVVG